MYKTKKLCMYVTTYTKIYYSRIILFILIVFRINQGEYRTMPNLAWEIAKIIHPINDYIL